MSKKGFSYFCRAALIITLLGFFSSLYAKDKVLIFRSGGANFDTVRQSFSMELEGTFEVVDYIIDSVPTVESMGKYIEKEAPNLILLMNNKAINLYEKYQQKLSITEKEAIPSISLMAAMVGAEVKDLKNSAAISYEVPVVTSVVNLRSILNIEKVTIGVIYREFLKEFIKENKEYCKRENIKMVSFFVPEGNKKYEQLLKKGLEHLAKKKKVDMIWVPNDVAFLTPKIIKSVWLPFSKKYNIPLIVGVENFLGSDISFGTFAVLPDHSALGKQAAEMAYQIKDDGWKVGGGSSIVEPPISIYKIISSDKASRFDKVDIKSVDKVVE